MRPARLRQHLAIQNLRAVRVKQGYGVRVLRIVGGRVDVVQRILGVGLGAILGEVEGFVVLDLVRRGLEEEGCRQLAQCCRCVLRRAYWGGSRLAWRHVAIGFVRRDSCRRAKRGREVKCCLSVQISSAALVLSQPSYAFCEAVTAVPALVRERPANGHGPPASPPAPPNAYS